MTLKDKVSWNKGFDCGYMCALATVMQQYGEETIVREALKENFLTVEQMKNSGVEQNDIDVLAPIVKEIERLRSR